MQPSLLNNGSAPNMIWFVRPFEKSRMLKLYAHAQMTRMPSALIAMFLCNGRGRGRGRGRERDEARREKKTGNDEPLLLLMDAVVTRGRRIHTLGRRMVSLLHAHHVQECWGWVGFKEGLLEVLIAGFLLTL